MGPKPVEGRLRSPAFNNGLPSSVAFSTNSRRDLRSTAREGSAKLHPSQSSRSKSSPATLQLPAPTLAARPSAAKRLVQSSFLRRLRDAKSLIYYGGYPNGQRPHWKCGAPKGVAGSSPVPSAFVSPCATSTCVAQLQSGSPLAATRSYCGSVQNGVNRYVLRASCTAPYSAPFRKTRHHSRHHLMLPVATGRLVIFG